VRQTETEFRWREVLFCRI